MKGLPFHKLALVALCIVPFASPVVITVSAQSRAQSRAQSATANVAIQELLHQYIRSIDGADINIASAIWSHGPDVSFIHPRGTEIGYDKIIANFYSNTMGLFSRRELTLHTPSISINGNAAWSQFTWTFRATLKENGREIATEGRETQIYRKESGSWRIVHVHYSGPPIQEAPTGF